VRLVRLCLATSACDSHRNIFDFMMHYYVTIDARAQWKSLDQYFDYTACIGDQDQGRPTESSMHYNHR